MGTVYYGPAVGRACLAHQLLTISPEAIQHSNAARRAEEQKNFDLAVSEIPDRNRA
jgi:hypothetical protein